MLKDFVEAIGALAVRSHAPQLVKDPFNPRKGYLIHDGGVRETAVSAPLLATQVETVESLVSVVETFAHGNASAWYNRERVEVVIDNEDRLERAYLPLRLSDQFNAIAKLPKSFDQRSLVLFLKRELYGAIDPAVISIFRNLDFSKREQAVGSIKHGDESLGRAVQAKVANAAEIPEFLPLTVRVYSNPDIVFRTDVRVSIDIDLQRGSIELTPLPDEIENALLAAENHVGEQLAEHLGNDSVFVFNGTPTMRTVGAVSNQ